MPSADDVKLRRNVALRFASYVTCLGLLTGLGLFFYAGMRDAASWGAFVLATVAVLVGLVWFVGSTLRSSSKNRHPRAAADSHSAAAEPAVNAAAGAKDMSGDDDVDYLTALRHEFRTPLNAVLGFSDVLLSGIDGEVNESQREDLEIIRASGIRLKLLVDSALDLSHLADDHLSLNADRIDVRELVARVAAEAGQLWSNKRSANCILPEEPCITRADESRLRRCILVLADFLATDHRDADIELSLARSGAHLAIEITAGASDQLSFDALPTTAEVLASEEASEIRRWPVAVTAEVISRHEGSLYHGNAPSRFLVRLPVQGAT
ncbi:MAG: HAMP domain-containing histidine kinase [Myxococcales bacterium]|nr:HAMP domain-containing histidine kinase [Myxococcales bacterium]